MKVEYKDEVIKVKYFTAEDGTTFSSEEQCERYESSALFAVSKSLKRLNKTIAGASYLCNNFAAGPVEIFDIQTETDLKNLKQYLYLKMPLEFRDDEGCNICIDKLSCGHEVLIFWNNSTGGFLSYGNGSLEGLCDTIKKCYFANFTNPDPQISDLINPITV